MIAEPIIITVDSEGRHRLVGEVFPLRTVIAEEFLRDASFVEFDKVLRTVYVTLAGSAAIYDRVGFGLHGEWICDLRMTPRANEGRV